MKVAGSWNVRWCAALCAVAVASSAWAEFKITAGWENVDPDRHHEDVAPEKTLWRASAGDVTLVRKDGTCETRTIPPCETIELEVR